jgi:hypothetical protein
MPSSFPSPSAAICFRPSGILAENRFDLFDHPADFDKVKLTHLDRE